MKCPKCNYEIIEKPSRWINIAIIILIALLIMILPPNPASNELKCDDFVASECKSECGANENKWEDDIWSIRQLGCPQGTYCCQKGLTPFY